MKRAQIDREELEIRANKMMNEVSELRQVLEERDATIQEFETRLESLEAEYCELQNTLNHQQTRA